MSASTALDIKLLGRAYSVACAPEERESLLEAVALLDAKMDELAKKTKSSGERLAVMTALNLAHELMDLKKSPEQPFPVQTSPAQPVDSSDWRRRIEAMEARLDMVLDQQEDLF